MWFIFALLSAVFAALTSILAKIGIDGVNSNLATVGNGFSYESSKYNNRNQYQKLAIPDPFGSGNGCIMVMLLLRAADWRRIESCTD